MRAIYLVSLTTSFVYDAASGVWTSQTEPNGSIRKQVLDGLGRIVSVLGPNPDGTLVPLSERGWGWDSVGLFRFDQVAMSWAQSDVVAWRHEYVDGLGRVYLIEMLAEGDATVQLACSYDSRDNVVRQSLPFFTGDTPVYIETDYDLYGRVEQVTAPADGGGSSVTRTTYMTTNHVVQVEAFGTEQARTTTLEYATFDHKRQVVSRVDACSAQTSYAYDALGRRTGVVDPLGVATSATYDAMGRQIASSVSQGDTIYWSESFVFDDAGRTITCTNGNGISTVQCYDGLKRLISRTVGDSPATTLAYDDAGAGNRLGRLSSASAPGSYAYAFAYDAHGNQTSIELTIDARQFAFERSFSPIGKVLTSTFPDGSVTTNTYTERGNIASVSLGSDSYATFDQFTAFGRPQQAAYPQIAQAQDLFSYNDVGQMSGQQVQGAGGEVLLNSKFHWDVLANLSSIDDLIDQSRSQSFQYDPVGRLAVSTGDYPDQSFAYDGGGNLTGKNGMTLVYDGYQPRSGSAGGATVFEASYDANGAMTQVTRQGVQAGYGYDGQGQLISCGNTAFTYDYAGRRLKKQVVDGPVSYYVAPDYEVTTLPGGAVQHTLYLAGEQGVFASVTTVEAGTVNPAVTYPGIPTPGTFYLHRNQINSTSVQTDAAGKLATRIEYLPYGEIAALSGTNNLRHKFTGKELDTETGLYYYHARYYDPWIGRFTTSDNQLGGSAVRPDAFNRYAYVLNSPVMNIDPTGHHSWGWWKEFGEQFGMYVADAALIVAGAVVMAGGTFVGAGPLATIVGSTLLGAGISGLAYNITQDIKGQPVSARDWGIQLGIGAATGLVGGALGVGASAAATALKIGAGAATIAFNVGAGAAIGAVTGLGSQMLNNAANHASISTALGSATLFGAIAGAAASGLAEGVSKLPVFQRPTNVDEFTALINEGDLAKSGYQSLSPELGNWAADIRVFNATPLNRFIVAWPGTIVNAINGAIWDMNWHPAW